MTKTVAALKRLSVPGKRTSGCTKSAGSHWRNWGLSKMGARKIKKKLRLHKAAPVPPKSAGYRTPFNDDQSPLRIAFDDHDEARGDLKLANIRGIDGNYR